MDKLASHSRTAQPPTPGTEGEAVGSQGLMNGLHLAAEKPAQAWEAESKNG